MTNTVNQKDAVFNAVTSVTTVSDGEAVQLTKDQKSTLIGMLAEGLESGAIETKEAKRAKMTEEKHYREYASNILNNWIRKDLRLNGGEPYKTKSPGSRAGSQDPQVKELRKFKSTLSDPEQIAAVDLAIETRVAELKRERNAAKITEINFDLIPEFAHLANPSE